LAKKEKNVIILGAGMVGSTIAADLSREYNVSALDSNRSALEALRDSSGIRGIEADLSDSGRIARAVAGADLVIGALPGFLGFQALEAVIESGKNIVDISFFPEDPFILDSPARRQGVTAVIDCGVAPGMCNIILGYYTERMRVDSYECLVGGVPVKRLWPYQYKAPFSPIDVLEEYVRPARCVENGHVVTKPALSDAEYVEMDPVGTLEAFNTDGLRTLLTTMRVPHMHEKTLRYPGHIEYIRVLRESGFLDKEPIRIKDTLIRPLDVTAALLFPKWRLEKGEHDMTLMRVTLEGSEEGRSMKYVYTLFDRYDDATCITSMARTTGYTCSVVARLLLEGEFSHKGICPPEYIGAAPGLFEKVLIGLRARGVKYDCGAFPTLGAVPPTGS
jgi:saccharopine dehydrogenase-like NADP-dependent oxidoreductase